jgi:hypothetical protein
MIADRSKAGLQALVESVNSDEPYGRLYPGTIVNQRGANSFDFIPDDKDVPGMAGIPIQNPTPGITFTVDVGQTPRALLGFQGKSPTAPTILLWEVPGLTSITVNPSANVNLGPASAAVGRVGDAVAAASAMSTWISSVSTALGVTPPTDFGTIAAGSPKVKA